VVAAGGLGSAEGAQIRLDLRARPADQVGGLPRERLGFLLPHLRSAEALGDLAQPLGELID
jgi:hypothetical protein